MNRAAHPGLPTIAAAQSTAHELLADGHPRTWIHTQVVAAKADRIAQALHLDPLEHHTLVCAAWLARIGEATMTPRHWAPIDGAAAADGWGYFRLSSLLAWHGAALEESSSNGQRTALFRYTRPDTRLADLLTYSDLTVHNDGTDCTLNDRIIELRSSSITADEREHLGALTRALPRLADIMSRVERQLRYTAASIH